MFTFIKHWHGRYKQPEQTRVSCECNRLEWTSKEGWQARTSEPTEAQHRITSKTPKRSQAERGVVHSSCYVTNQSNSTQSKDNRVVMQDLSAFRSTSLDALE